MLNNLTSQWCTALSSAPIRMRIGWPQCLTDCLCAIILQLAWFVARVGNDWTMLDYLGCQDIQTLSLANCYIFLSIPPRGEVDRTSARRVEGRGPRLALPKTVKRRRPALGGETKTGRLGVGIREVSILNCGMEAR